MGKRGPKKPWRWTPENLEVLWWLLGQGLRANDIGYHFGVGGGAIRSAMKRSGLPSPPDWVPSRPINPRSGMPLKDETGNVYGKLAVLERAPSRRGRTQAYWLCQCSCGKQVIVAGRALRAGQTSCACAWSKPRKWTREKLRALTDLVKMQLTAREIATRLGETEGSVSQVMMKRGIKSKSPGRPGSGRHCYVCGVDLTSDNSYTGKKKDSTCKECAKADSRKRREKHRRENPLWHQQQMLKLKEWKAANPEKVRHKNQEKQRRKERAGLRGSLPFTHWKTMMELFGWRCAYCDCWLDKGNAKKPTSRVIEHFIPVASGGRNDYTNVVASCRKCNDAKGVKMPREWIQDEQRYEAILTTLGDIDRLLNTPAPQ